VSLIVPLVLFGAAALVLIGYVLYARRPKHRPNKKKEKAKAELKKIEEQARVPEGVAPPQEVAPSTGLEQFPISKKIPIEMTRVKEGTNKRVTTRKGTVTLTPRFGNKDIFYFDFGKMRYFVDPSKTIPVVETKGRKTITTEKLVYDVFNSEPLNKDGTISFSWELERLMRDSALDQYLTVATFEGGFQMTPQLRNAVLVIAILGVLIGLALNGSLGLTPKTVIHWLP
jgi:hypothetical protein